MVFRRSRKRLWDHLEREIPGLHSDITAAYNYHVVLFLNLLPDASCLIGSRVYRFGRLCPVATSQSIYPDHAPTITI